MRAPWNTQLTNYTQVWNAIINNQSRQKCLLTWQVQMHQSEDWPYQLQSTPDNDKQHNVHHLTSINHTTYFQVSLWTRKPSKSANFDRSWSCILISMVIPHSDFSEIAYYLSSRALNSTHSFTGFNVCPTTGIFFHTVVHTAVKWHQFILQTTQCRSEQWLHIIVTMEFLLLK